MYTNVPLIPREVLFGNPERFSPHISPDAKKIAYIAPKDGVLNVWVRTLGQNDDYVVTDDRERGIRAFFWAYDNKHLLYVQDKGGDENWHLYRVNLETREVNSLTPFPKVQVQIIDQNKYFPGELLIAMNKENEKVHDVYHLTIETGELKMVAQNTGTIASWLVDSQFKVLGAVSAMPDGSFDLLYRKNELSEWQKILNWDSENGLSSGPISFSKDGKKLYLKDSTDANTTRLAKYDIATQKKEVIAEDTEYDVGTVLFNPDTYRIEAFSFIKQRVQWHTLDVSVKKDFEILTNLEKGELFITNRDIENKHWIVGFDRDIGSAVYYVYDREKKKATFLFDARPQLKKYKLAKMLPISYKTRDGLTVHGYLTYPEGVEKKNLPLILNVHGGPWTRDNWGWDPEAQLFANRGYACLQVNYRGSMGYGKDFLNAGNREWGGKMHDDLIDAANWVVKHKIADPKKIAIFGGSYGGYAALVGATFTPDVFCCSVDFVGVSNLLTFLNSIPPYWSSFMETFKKRVGDPEKDKDFLISRSPLFKVNNIIIPMLIAQGANDPRVKQAESEQIVEAMKTKGIDHEYMLFSDEGHGFAKPENRLKFYAHSEKFLAQYLGGRFEEESIKHFSSNLKTRPEQLS